MRAIAAILGLALLSSAAAMADRGNWLVRCGLDDNLAPYGNDFATFFGVAPLGTWDFDLKDSAHPPIFGTDLGFIYDDDYYKLYRDWVPHDVGTQRWTEPVGWPPPWKPWIDGIPTYPYQGLIKDIRELIVEPLCPELWQVNVYAPIAGETCSLDWFWFTDSEWEVPPWIQVQVWGNPDLESAGVEGDLILNEFGPGEHKIPGIAQWGVDEDTDMPIKHLWVIQATALIPEPVAVSLAGLALGLAGLARIRRR
jgi:hypothetical protein